MSQAWNTGHLAGVLAAGNITQIYPAHCTAGTGATTQGTWKRRPMEGTLMSVQVETDGATAGTLELWDADGNLGGDDVDTAAAITDAHMAAMVAAGTARKIYEQSFLGTTGARLNIAAGTPIMKGLAARFYNAGAAGWITLSIVADGLFVKTQITGS